MKCWHTWSKWETIDKGTGVESPKDAYYMWHNVKSPSEEALIVAHYEVQRRECKKCGICELREESASVA